MPEELTIQPFETDNFHLINILMKLNDGMLTILTYNKIVKQYPNLKFRFVPNIVTFRRYTFDDIADFIEDNVKLV